MMVRAVRLSQRAQKELRLAPPQVRSKLKVWINGVSKDGLEEMRKIPGFHDEPLRGKRNGQRSIRLSRSYRAIYKVLSDGTLWFAEVEEVTKHGY
jgi:proteic killer suppression protein